MNKVFGEKSKYSNIDVKLDCISGDKVEKYWLNDCIVGKIIYYGTQVKIKQFRSIKNLILKKD
jgi:hypothetical protein